MGFHKAGFHAILSLVRVVGFEVPRTILVYSIAVNEPRSFSESLSVKLIAKLLQIVETVAAELPEGKRTGTPSGRRLIPGTSRGKKAWFRTASRPAVLHGGEPNGNAGKNLG